MQLKVDKFYREMRVNFVSVGERIASLRSSSSLSQGQLADRMGVTRQAVSKWENDLSCPDPLRLVQLADALDTDVEYLATGVHCTVKAEPIVIHQVVEKPVYIEKTVEKPVYLEKQPDLPKEKVVTVTKEVPVERIVERVVEKPVVKKVVRIRYRNNPFVLLASAGVGLIIGLLIGLLF